MLLALFVVVSMAVNAVTIDTYEVRLDKTNKTAQIKNYCCPLKLRPSRARVCMHMQALKNKKLG